MNKQAFLEGEDNGAARMRRHRQLRRLTRQRQIVDGSIGTCTLPRRALHMLGLLLVVLSSTSPALAQPQIDAVVNTASFQPLVSAGVNASIFGPNLANGVCVAPPGQDWPTQLCDAEVTVGGQSAAIGFASAGQLNVHFPVGLAPGPADVVVSVNGVPSNNFAVTIETHAPGIFGDFSGPPPVGVFFNASMDLITASTPAILGSDVFMFMTGLGDTNPPVGTGQISPINPRAATVDVPAVSVAGVPAVVISSTLSPEAVPVGGNRVEFTIPAAAGSGFHNVEVSIGGQTSNTVLLPVVLVDGNVSVGGGVVMDDVHGANAQVQIPAGVLSEPTNVAIEVIADPNVPIPAGFSEDSNVYTYIDLDPEPNYPLPPPGLTATIPLQPALTPGSQLWLCKIDPVTKTLIAAIGVNGAPVTGPVNPDGLSATFEGVASLSTVVGLRLLSPTTIIEELIADVNDLVAAGKLTTRQGKALKAELKGVIQSLERGKKVVAAILLKSFIASVKVLVLLRQLPLADGQALIGTAEAVLLELKQ